MKNYRLPNNMDSFGGEKNLSTLERLDLHRTIIQHLLSDNLTRPMYPVSPLWLDVDVEGDKLGQSLFEHYQIKRECWQKEYPDRLNQVREQVKRYDDIEIIQ